MLYFVETYFAIHYLILASIASLGTFQIVATRHGLRGLSLVGRPRWSGWGYGLGGTLIAGGFAWFFLSTPNVLSPGPAGTELLLLMGLGTAGALVFTLAWASVCQEIRVRRGSSTSELDAGTRGLSLLRDMSILQAWRRGGHVASHRSGPDYLRRAEMR
ncbi:MAG: hypothetical protein DRI52_04760 [Chloroflexi bacterium]|nr:MAG: hypothetical protein DRI52_04760 [Chloroflexota bacterium]